MNKHDPAAGPVAASHCRHLGHCGGCATTDRKGFDKAGALRAALARAGFSDPALAPLVAVQLATRRRVDLAARRDGAGGLALGLHQARSGTVVDMTECVLLEPRLLALLPPLRVLLRSLESFHRSAAVIINLLDHGPDVLLRLDAPATVPDRRRITDFARAHGLLRIAVAQGDAAPEPVAVLAPPVLTLAGVAVQPAPGAFLQASRDGEAAIVDAVLAGLPKLPGKARIVELYAGIGTLTFALAKQARLEAYEGAPAALATLQQALRAANLAGRITATQRDLARRPLQPAELADRAAVVLDPPYAGAAPQMRFLAAAAVPRVIYVSCNPAALAEDARVLRQAGYQLLRATPIDQFPFSDNLESVVVFGR